MTKQVDPRKIKAIGLFHCMDSPTFGKMIDSCKLAGYSDSHSEQRCSNILDLDSLTDRDWQDLKNLLPQLVKVVKIWLDKHEDNVETKDIREIWKGIRLIGDSVGKFIKREERIEHKIDEKRAVIIYGTPEEHKKALEEKMTVIKSQLAQIDKQGE